METQCVRAVRKVIHAITDPHLEGSLTPRPLRTWTGEVMLCCVCFRSGASSTNSADASACLSSWWPRSTGWPDTRCCWRASGRGVRTLPREPWSTPSRKRWKRQFVSPWVKLTQSSSGSLIKELGGSLAPGNHLGFCPTRSFHWFEVMALGTVVLSSSALWIGHTQNNGLWSHPGEPDENSATKCVPDVTVSKVFSSELRQEKSCFPDDGKHFVFHIHTEPKHKADGNTQRGKLFRRINDYSSFL